MELLTGHAYLLDGMTTRMWQNSHTEFGRPRRLAALFLGCVHGNRSWYLFEVYLRGKEEGVLLLNTDDLDKLTLTLVE